MWIGLADLLLCILSVVIVAVAPVDVHFSNLFSTGIVSDAPKAAGQARL
jgi:hypothetical protein